MGCDKHKQHCAGIGSIVFAPTDGCRVNYCSKLVAYVSDDGGRTWTEAHYIPQPSEFVNGLSSIFCSNNGLNCSAVGFISPDSSPRSYPYFIYTMDGGNNWNESEFQFIDSINPHDRLYGVACNSKGILCASVGIYYAPDGQHNFMPLSYYTKDAGRTWKLSKTLPPPVTQISWVEKISCNKKNNVL